MPQVETSCERCGTTFLTWPSRLKVGKSRFCSRACTNAAAVTRVDCTCQRCGAVWQAFKSHVEAGGGKYCSSECFHASRVTPGTDGGWYQRECEQCGEGFRALAGQVHRGRGRFCSRRCWGDWWASQAERVTLTCDHCGETFTDLASQAKWTEGSFCRRRCYELWQRNRLTRTCETCGIEFERQASHVAKSGGRFCSGPCFFEWNQRENHPNWTGGESQYSKRKAKPGKHSKRDIRRLYHRQRGECAICHSSIADGFHRDHIIPLVRGGTHYIGNIQLTCPPCNIRKNRKLPIELRAELQAA